MQKFKITISSVVAKTIEVDANSEKEAKDLAEEAMNKLVHDMDYHDPSIEEVERVT